jgi:hypothetical protein
METRETGKPMERKDQLRGMFLLKVVNGPLRVCKRR